MFKQCSSCLHPWEDRGDFLADPDIKIIGYQASFGGVQDGLFLFNHRCRTTLALEVRKFDDLYEGPRNDMDLHGTDECSGFCLDIKELSVCGAKCKYAYVRNIIQVIRKWQKFGQENGNDRKV